MKNAALIDQLDKEAMRFKGLAKDAALNALLNPENHDAARKAREHLIRAESFKDAARIVASKS